MWALRDDVRETMEVAMNRKAMRPGRVGSVAVLGLAVLLAVASLAQAQGTSGGARVSVTLRAGSERIVGRLVGVRADAVILEDTYGADRTIPVADISTLRVSRKSAVVPGLLLGMAAGGAIGYAASAPHYRHVFMGEIGIAFDTGIGAAVGGAVGGIIGSGRVRGKTYNFGAMSAAETEKALAKLRKKARVPDYR